MSSLLTLALAAPLATAAPALPLPDYEAVRWDVTAGARIVNAEVFEPLPQGRIAARAGWQSVYAELSGFVALPPAYPTAKGQAELAEYGRGAFGITRERESGGVGLGVGARLGPRAPTGHVTPAALLGLGYEVTSWGLYGFHQDGTNSHRSQLITHALATAGGELEFSRRFAARAGLSGRFHASSLVWPPWPSMETWPSWVFDTGLVIRL